MLEPTFTSESFYCYGGRNVDGLTGGHCVTRYTIYSWILDSLLLTLRDDGEIRHFYAAARALRYGLLTFFHILHVVQFRNSAFLIRFAFLSVKKEIRHFALFHFEFIDIVVAVQGPLLVSVLVHWTESSWIPSPWSSTQRKLSGRHLIPIGTCRRCLFSLKNLRKYEDWHLLLSLFSGDNGTCVFIIVNGDLHAHPSTKTPHQRPKIDVK